MLGLPQAHLRTLAHLMRHLHRVSLAHRRTGMTSRNLAIVWAPNLLRAPDSASQDCLRDIGVQALVIETLILHYKAIFDPSSDTGLYAAGEEKEEIEEVGVEGREFTQEVSIDQAVARAEQKEEEERRPRRPMVRSISCTRGLPGGLGVGGAFQRRGVTLRRDRSLQQDDLRGEEEEVARRRRREEETARRQLVAREAAKSASSTPSPAHKVRVLQIRLDLWTTPVIVSRRIKPTDTPLLRGNTFRHARQKHSLRSAYLVSLFNFIFMGTCTGAQKWSLPNCAYLGQQCNGLANNDQANTSPANTSILRTFVLSNASVGQ